MFIKANGKIINVDHITDIDCTFSTQMIRIIIWLTDGTEVVVNDQQAVDIVMKLCPSVLEGHKVKFVKHAWAIHNLIGHPWLQILSWIGLHKLGFKIHDGTVPRPVKLR